MGNPRAICIPYRGGAQKSPVREIVSEVTWVVRYLKWQPSLLLGASHFQLGHPSMKTVNILGSAAALRQNLSWRTIDICSSFLVIWPVDARVLRRDFVYCAHSAAALVRPEL
jgi:hypothetical protein